ncbi:hypothetical protein E2562_018138 [Oryza meyeriana var. granulata]|uniref:Uncharacterized protein n=1 Tax=Oryza meyeriana var. granulata TaxID=110450 RepID=A0A6G1C875_9ORYZ|nr:hypothetical protein E2562_018138 [Oryza meyeriana var. granulata]
MWQQIWIRQHNDGKAAAAMVEPIVFLKPPLASARDSKAAAFCLPYLLVSGQGAATASKGRPQRAVDKGKGRPRRARGGLGGRRADPAAAVASGGQGAASAGGSCFLHRRAAGLGQE